MRLRLLALVSNWHQRGTLTSRAHYNSGPWEGADVATPQQENGHARLH